MTAKTPRWLDLVAFLLQHRFPVTREQIFDKVEGYDGERESARRKFERDKDELRALGIDIETVDMAPDSGDTTQAGYRLKAASTYLPYFELVDEPGGARPYPNVGQFLLTRVELELLDRATRFLADQAPLPSPPLRHRRAASSPSTSPSNPPRSSERWRCPSRITPEPPSPRSRTR
jgi:hypothetical protein